MKIRLLFVLAIASLLGIFHQSIAYFIHDHVVASAPIYYVTACTIISIVLFTAVLVTLIVKRSEVDHWGLYMFATPILLLVVGGWSAFVTAMWWG